MKIVLALLPILCMLLSMTVFRLSSHRTAILASVLSVIIAFAAFSMPLISLFTASIEGLAVAMITIVFVIFSAVFMYNISVKSGAILVVRKLLFKVSSDRRVAVLLIAFCFGGFLEGIAGFGTAVILPVGMLILLGFDAMRSVLVCLAANTIPVAFGVLGVPAVTLAQVTGLNLGQLTGYIAFQLLPFTVFLPAFLIVLSEGSLKALRGVLGISLFTGLSFAAVQTVIAVAVGPELAAVGGSIASGLAVVAVAISRRGRIGKQSSGNSISADSKNDVAPKEAILACLPYFIILVLALLPRLLFSVDTLKQFPFSFSFKIYSGAGAKPTGFQFLLNGGLILLVSAIAGGLLQKLRFKAIWETMRQTLVQVRFNVLTVVFLTILSKVMGYSGMVGEIALGLYALFGGLYPLAAPLVGAFGTFLTGSDTSSNVLFGQMQRQIAGKLLLSEAWISAANAAGATAGKMMSPQSISIAVSSAGMKSGEGKILRSTSLYCLIYVALMGLLVWLLPIVIQIP